MSSKRKNESSTRIGGAPGPEQLLDRARAEETRKLFSRQIFVARQIATSTARRIGISFLTASGVLAGLALAPLVFIATLVKRGRLIHADGVLCKATILADGDEPGHSVGARLAGPALLRFSVTVESHDGKSVLGLAIRTRRPRDEDSPPDVGDQDLVFATFESFLSLFFGHDKDHIDDSNYLANDYDSVTPFWIREIGEARLRIPKVHEGGGSGNGSNRRERLEWQVANGPEIRLPLYYHPNDGKKGGLQRIAVIRVDSISPLPPEQLRISLRRGRGIVAAGFRNGLRYIVYPVTQFGRRLLGR